MKPEEFESNDDIQQGFSYEKQKDIQRNLNLKLGPDYISYRSGGGANGKVPYIEGWKAIHLANEIFGFDGWSSRIRDIVIDYIDELGDFRYSCGVSATVQVQLKSGTFHEDLGYGISENQRGKGAALEKAKKEAITDAIKRCLRLFGSSLGNCVYDKEYLQAMRRLPNGLMTTFPSLREPFTSNEKNIQAMVSKNEVIVPHNYASKKLENSVTRSNNVTLSSSTVSKSSTTANISLNQPEVISLPLSVPKQFTASAAINIPKSINLETREFHEFSDLDDNDMYQMIDSVEFELNANNYQEGSFPTPFSFDDNKRVRLF